MGIYRATALFSLWIISQYNFCSAQLLWSLSWMPQQKKKWLTEKHLRTPLYSLRNGCTEGKRGLHFTFWFFHTKRNCCFSLRPKEWTWESERDPLVHTATCSGAMLAEGSTICPKPQLGCSFHSLMCLSKDVKITDLLSLNVLHYCTE